jgi:hypothetical protein
MRRRGWVAIACVSVVLIGGYWAAAWYVERAVLSRLMARGFEASIGNVAWWPGAVRLDEVQFSHPTGTVHGELRRVRVAFGFSGVSRVSVQGGVIHMRGSVDEVQRVLRPQSQERPAEESSAAQTLPVFGEDLALDWERPLAENSGLSLSGIVVERTHGQLALRITDAQGSGNGLSYRAEAIVARLRLPDLGVQVLQMKQGNVTVDWGRLMPPVREPNGASPGDESPTRGKPASQPTTVPNPALAWVSRSPGRGQRLRQMIARAGGIITRRLPAEGTLDLNGVTLTLRQKDETLSIGPGQIFAKREGDVLRVGFVSGNEPHRPEFEISLQAPLSEGQVEGRVKGGPLTLATLGVRPGNFGLQEVDRAKLTIDSQFTLSSDGARAEFSTMGEIEALAVQHERIAPYALTDMNFGWSLDGSLAVDGSAFTVKGGKVNFGRVQVLSELSFVRSEDRLELHADAKIEAGSCADMFDALPHGAAPLLRDARMTGDFRWHGGIHLDSDHLAQTNATWNMRNRCRFSQVPADTHPEQFRTQFNLNVPDFDGQPLDLRTGPGSTHWTPLQEMSPYMESAVLTTEDGAFYNHHGFDSSAIEGAIRSNMESGKFTRGASTISMQLAKNLYLERDKYIARKIQEALLTMLLEQELTKREILELYLNVIEYGPGVYGIRKAAKHYFNSSPSELSVAQCFFLASILPKPKGQYFEENGILSLSRARVVRRLLKVAEGRARITPVDFAEGVAEQLKFRVPHLASNPYRNADGSPAADNFYRGGDEEENDNQ